MNAPTKDMRTKALENLLMHYLKSDARSGHDLKFWVSDDNVCSISFARAAVAADIDALIEQLKLTRKFCSDARRDNPIDAVNKAFASIGEPPIEDHPELKQAQ